MTNKYKNVSEKPMLKQWNPNQANDRVAGTLVRVEKRGRFGKAAILQDEAGQEWSILLGYKTLKEKWEEANPRQGSLVEIEYLRSGDFNLSVKDEFREEVARLLRKSGNVSEPKLEAGEIP